MRENEYLDLGQISAAFTAIHCKLHKRLRMPATHDLSLILPSLFFFQPMSEIGNTPQHTHPSLSLFAQTMSHIKNLIDFLSSITSF